MEFMEPKGAGEKQSYSVDFSNDLASGESLTGTPTVTSTVPASGITISNITLSGNTVTWYLAGGTAGVEYEMLVQCDSDSSVAGDYEKTVIIPVITD